MVIDDVSGVDSGTDGASAALGSHPLGWPGSLDGPPLEHLSYQVLDATPAGVALTSTDGQVLWSNRSWITLAGRRGGHIGGHVSDLLDAAGVASDAALVERLLSGRSTSVEVEQRWSLPDGTVRWVTLIGSIAVDRQGDRLHVAGSDATVIVRQVVDITDRIFSERAAALSLRELQRRNADLERSNAELAEFAYVVSHDLSEPLRVISGHVQLLERRYAGRLDATADEWIAFAVDGCARLRALIDDLLAYSRAGRDEPPHSEVDSGALVRRVVDGLAASVAESDAVVEVGVLPDLVGDPSQLSQVLANLIENALKFRRPDVRPEVSVTGSVRPAEDGSGDVVEIVVADNGIGVPERHRERIFGVFQRLHERDAYPGTGIGLAVSRKIADRHHGTITVTDSPAGGASFHLVLPATAPVRPSDLEEDQ